MTTYLSRPVFDLDINWAATPKKMFSYDLRELSLAFAAPRFERLQSHTSQAIEFELPLDTESKLAAWDEFTEALSGRLSGFWFASPFAALGILPDVSANDQFLIRNQGFQIWCQDHPCQHLVFTKRGQAPQFARIRVTDPVQATADGRERVFLEDAVATVVDETWDCCKLLYVRLASDEETAESYGEGRQVRTVRVIELPTEYAQIESGQVPVYLYEFAIVNGGVTQLYRQTGLNQDIASHGSSFHSFSVAHRDLVKSLRADREELVLESWHEEGNPLSLFIPFKLPAPLWVRVYETTFADPETRTLIFTGKVLSVGNEGRKLTAKCAGVLDVLGRRFPRFYIQPRCNHFVYDAHCKATLNQCGGNIRFLSGRFVKVDLSSPPFPNRPESAEFNFFGLGWVEVGSGATFERRSILQSSALTKYQTGPDRWEMALNLDRPFDHAIVGNLMQLIPGCDGSYVACVTKFGNGARYGGFDNIPTTNPSVRAMKADNPSGNKK